MGRSASDGATGFVLEGYSGAVRHTQSIILKPHFSSLSIISRRKIEIPRVEETRTHRRTGAYRFIPRQH
jgi:hypothetical protein